MNIVPKKEVSVTVTTELELPFYFTPEIELYI